MIKENCQCGATFEVDCNAITETDSFSRGSERDRYRDFLEAHKICRGSDSEERLSALENKVEQMFPTLN